MGVLVGCAAARVGGVVVFVRLVFFRRARRRASLRDSVESPWSDSLLVLTQSHMAFIVGRRRAIVIRRVVPITGVSESLTAYHFSLSSSSSYHVNTVCVFRA